MKARSDSLYAELSRLGTLDDFFAFVATELPSYEDMRNECRWRHALKM